MRKVTQPKIAQSTINFLKILCSTIKLIVVRDKKEGYDNRNIKAETRVSPFL